MVTVRKIELPIAVDAKDAERGFEKVSKAAKDAQKDIEKVGDSDPFSGLTDSLDGASSGIMDKLGGLGEMAGGVFAGALAGAGVAGVGLLVEGFQTALDQEVTTDKLAAQLGATGQFAEDLGKDAGDLYVQGFGDSMADVADAIKEVWRGGILPEDATNEQIESMTGQVMTFVDVLDQDLTESVNAVSQMMRTGLAKDGTEALDILTRGIQQGADKAGDLAETFNEYSTQFRELGLSGAEAAGLMVQGVRAGARDADIVADALKEFAIRAQDGSTLTKEAFEDLGLAGDEMTEIFATGGPQAAAGLDTVLDRLRAVPDPAERSRLAVALFGTQAEDMQNALNSMDLSNAVAELGTVGGATDGLGTAYDNTSAKIEVFKREALQKLTDFIANSVIPWIDAHKGQIKDLANTIQAWGQTIMAVAGNLLHLAQVILGPVVGALQTAWSWGNKLVNILNDIPGIGGGGLAQEGHILEQSMGKTGKTIPKFALGGDVPGPPGAPMLAIVHGGERVLTAAQAAGGGGMVLVENHFHGAILDGREVVDILNEQQRKGYRLHDRGRDL